MKPLWKKIILFVLVLWMTSFACNGSSTPTVTGVTPHTVAPTKASLATLQPEKAHVYFEPVGQAQQDINQIKSAGPGDQIWTQNGGQALLKWPDVHIRLYSDPQNPSQMTFENATPTWLSFALYIGAILNCRNPDPVKRVTITTPNSKVEIVGSTVMVAYIPQKQITVIRVFEGRVNINKLTSGSIGMMNAISGLNSILVE